MEKARAHPDESGKTPLNLARFTPGPIKFARVLKLKNKTIRLQKGAKNKKNGRNFEKLRNFFKMLILPAHCGFVDSRVMVLHTIVSNCSYHALLR